MSPEAALSIVDRAPTTMNTSSAPRPIGEIQDGLQRIVPRAVDDMAVTAHSGDFEASDHVAGHDDGNVG
ncbi:MAG: hypothetical protein AAGA21_20855 [Pseudomonadota bacterium]